MTSGWQQISVQRVYKVAVGWVFAAPDKPGGTTQSVVYATMDDGTFSGGTYVYNGIPGSWTKIGPSYMKLVTHGKTLYGHDYYGRQPYQYMGAPGVWQPVGSPAFDIYGGVVGLFATMPDKLGGDIYAYNSILSGSFRPGWTRIGGPGNMFAVGSQHLYGLSPDKSGVYEFNFETTGWTNIGEAWDSIYAGGDKLYAAWHSFKGPVYEYNRGTGQWTPIGKPWGEGLGAPGDMFAADPLKGNLYALGPAKYRVWLYVGIPGVWTEIGKTAGSIYPGWPGVFATNPDTGQLWSFIP